MAVSPIDQNINSAEAAEILNVSPDYLEKLLDQEEIPFQVIGTSRQIKSKDLLDYKRSRDINRRKGLIELTSFIQETGNYVI